MSEALKAALSSAAKALRPPPKLNYSDWAEQNVRVEVDGQIRRFRPWKFQRKWLDCFGDPLVERITIIKCAQVGYALALDTPIPTTRGWATMGSVALGDELLDEAGKPCRVTFVSPVYTDHRCYRIEFDDGSSIVADEGHRWFVHSDKSFELMLEGRHVRGEGARATYEGVLDTGQIAQHHRRGARSCFAVPAPAVVDLPERDLPVPPYALGLWLGDGHSGRLWVTQHTGDVETADYVRESGVPVVVEKCPHWENNLTYRYGCDPKLFRAMGLLTSHKETGTKKHIPPAYLRSSASQRLELLRGIMDSDGSITPRGRADISVTCKPLFEGVCDLLASLGIKYRVSRRAPQNERCMEQWRIQFRPTPDLNPFKIRRKAGRVRPAVKETVLHRRRVISVTPVDSVPVRCIQVDSPSHLFLAGERMVPTHNTTCMAASIGADMQNDPTSVILLMPTDDDCTGIMVDDVDPLFNNSPSLSPLVNRRRTLDERNTLTQRKYPGGGSLKALAARSPRNLRRHRARKLYCDEVDGMEITKEGDPVALAENRTESFPDRKIIIGSTPKDAATSFVLMRWKESNQQVFEVPCPQCGHRFELEWEHMRWTPHKPATAYAVCPMNGCVIEERHKAAMVEAGEWRATKPDVVDHSGFRINALVSLQPNAKWANQVRKYEKAKRAGPSLLQPFYNTVLGKAWETTLDKVSEDELQSRVEKFGLKRIEGDVAWDCEIPEPVRYITLGVDVQGDRLELGFYGWSETQRWVLGHEVIRGATTLESTWDELLGVITTRWKHPLGGTIGIEATAIDSGDGNRTQQVYNFAARHEGKRVFAIKGDGGPRPIIKIAAARKKRRVPSSALIRPWIVGVDTVKADILTSVNLERGAPGTFRFSAHLDEEWFRQFTAEQKVIEYVKGRPVAKFERIEGRQAEALDCAVYAIAVRQLCRFDFKARERELSVKPPLKKDTLKSALSKLHG